MTVVASDPLADCINVAFGDWWRLARGAVTQTLGEFIPAKFTLYGYMCPECKTWAEDMTPHCFNEHADDPVATLPFYVRKES